jgi:predicted nucleic acid-binding protein
MKLIVDSSPLLAHLDADDLRHAECRQLLETYAGSLVVPTLCIAEVSHFAARHLGLRAELCFLESIDAGALLVEHVLPVDVRRMNKLVSIYGRLPLGAVDASVIAVAERLGVATIATMDRDRFGAVRPAHVEKFEFLP